MSVTMQPVAPDERDIRLDRWFRRHYPLLPHSRLSKLLRTGQVRVDGKRAQAGQRLSPGQQIRVPPLALNIDGPVNASQGKETRAKTGPSKATPRVTSPDKAAQVQSWVIYRDDDVIAINKPSGLAVQGGTGTTQHLDAMLDDLAFEGERPRLVHRLDKDTSGVLLLARSAAMAAKLAEAFRDHTTQKTYWALVAGHPRPISGIINAPIAKRASPDGFEKMTPISGNDPKDGKADKAQTYYDTIEVCGTRATWLRLRPVTGRTHQLRVHCAVLETPIVGDAKYGGPDAQIPGLPRKLHLHAAGITLPHPRTGRPLTARAPLTGHMAKSWAFLGLDPNAFGAWPEHDPREAEIPTKPGKTAPRKTRPRTTRPRTPGPKTTGPRTSRPRTAGPRTSGRRK